MSILIAIGSGLAAAAAGAHPTGNNLVDIVLVALTTAAVVWASATAPWWALAGAAAIAASFAMHPVALVGAVGFVLALRIGLSDDASPAARALTGALAVNTLIRSHFDDVFGATALVGIATCCALFIVGVTRRDRIVQRRVGRVLLVLTAATVLVSVTSALMMVRTRNDISRAQHLAEVGLALMLDGDYDAAADALDEAVEAFGRADETLSNPLASGGRAIPVVAQHHRMAGALVTEGDVALTDAATAVRAISRSDLSVIDGAIDLGAVAAMEDPVRRVADALVRLDRTIEDNDTPWLVAPIRRRLFALTDRLERQIDHADRLVDVVALAPRLLGEDGPRTYLLGFTTPAEARGVGGLVGNYAELRVDDGRFTLVDFGRGEDLNGDQADPPRRTIDGPPDFLERYGRYGFVNSDGDTGSVPWSNVTMPADFRLTADVMAQLYPQSGGTDVDGVIIMDPYVLAALASFGGPIELPAIDRTIEPAETADFLLFSQYELDQSTRVDLLDAVARSTVDRLLAGALPAPAVMGASLAPLAQQRRILVWMNADDEQAVVEANGLSGRLPALDGSDGLAVTVNNASASKIDAYLARQIEHVVRVDPQTGWVRSSTAITLTNTAPPGLPFVVIGNEIGLPIGTNRTLLSVYTGVAATRVEVDGQPVAFANESESGWSVVSEFLTLESGGSVTVTVHTAGRVDLGDGYRLELVPQPLVIASELSVDLSFAEGDPTADSVRVIDEAAFIVPEQVVCRTSGPSPTPRNCSVES